MNEGMNSAFLQLKPICDSIATEPTIENVTELQKIIPTISISVLQRLHEFIIFPLFLNLQNEELRSKNNVKLVISETLHYILKRIRLQKLKVYTHLYMVLVQQIYDKNSPTLVAECEEEFKLSIMQCLISIFKNISMDLLCDLYTRENSVHFTQCLHTCIQIAKTEKLRSLRLKTIECLMTISYIHDDADFMDKEVREQVADVIMFFLPGIVIGLRDIAIGDEKQGHKITTLSVKALSRFIVLLMQDEECLDRKTIVFEYPLKQEEMEDTETSEKKKKTIEEMVNSLKNDKRTSKWYKDTANKLQMIVESINPLQHHNHPLVRYQLAEMCEDILTYCCVNLVTSVGNCIEILIALSEDDDPKVLEKSRKALENKLEKSLKVLNTTSLEIVEENFYNVLTRLPRIINGTDLTKQLSALNLLVGYLRLLGPTHLLTILQSASHLKRLVHALIHVSQLERSNISLFEEHAIRDFENVSKNPITWKQFTYISEKSLQMKLKIGIQLLSESSAIDILADHLCDIFINELDYRNEVIFLLNELLSVKVDNMKNHLSIINRVISMYLEEDNWYLPLSVQKESDYGQTSLFEAHNNIIQTCLLVEGIGNMALALEETFKSFLFKTLYVVLERAGSAQPLISAAGFSTLLNISKACGYTSVTSLIVDNTDYFSFHVIQRMKKLERNPMVLDVLNVVMNYSTVDMLPPIMDIINRVLIQSCDTFQENNSTTFLKVFLSFIKNLQRWLTLEIKKENKTIDLLMDYKKNMDVLYNLYSDVADDFTNLDINETTNDNALQLPEENDDYYKKPVPPNHIKLAVSILKRSLNFLPHKDRQRKLLVLEILRYGVETIRDYEDEFLPIVHLIWSPLVDRFKEFTEPLIINRSFELLTALARLSKDFIRHRTSKNIFGTICSTLKILSDQSYLKDRGSAYRYTQSYKLQMSLLKDLPQLVTDLEMNITDITLALEAAKSYLNNKQPLPLQELAVAFYKSMAYYDFDSVWLFLLNIHGVNSSVDENIPKEGHEKNIAVILNVLELAKW